MRTHPRQMRVLRRIGVVKFVVVVGDIGKHAARGEQMIRDPQIRSSHYAQLIHIEVFRAAYRLIQHGIKMKINARLVDIPALFSTLWHDRLHAFLRQRSFMSQRFAFQMAFQAGDIGFSGDLRQIKAVFRHADRADPLRQIVHDDPVSAHDPFTGVAVLHLFTGNV